MEGLVLVLRQRPGHVVRGSYSGRSSSTTTLLIPNQRNRFTGNYLFSCRSTLSGNCSMISGGSVLRCVILPKETWLQKKSGVNNHFIRLIFFHCSTSGDHKPDVQPGNQRSNVFNSAFNVNIEPQTNKEICSV